MPHDPPVDLSLNGSTSMQTSKSLARENLKSLKNKKRLVARISAHTNAASIGPIASSHCVTQTDFAIMSYMIVSIPNKEGLENFSPEQSYRKLQNAGACASKPFAGKKTQGTSFYHVWHWLIAKTWLFSYER